MIYSYSSWSVVFGEQPSASKWNTLGTNDASFHERIGTNFSSGTTSPVWWEELGRTTLGSNGDTITLSSLGARKFLHVHISLLPTGGTINASVTFNNDTAANYARRASDNGGADASAVSQSNLPVGSSTGAYPFFIEFDVINISAQEKLVMGHTVDQNTAGAANQTNRREFTGKWANTSAQISRVDVTNSGTGDYATSSVIVVKGHD